MGPHWLYIHLQSSIQKILSNLNQLMEDINLLVYVADKNIANVGLDGGVDQGDKTRRKQVLKTPFKAKQ